MPKRTWPRLQFTLRAFLVFIALFMLWGGFHTNRSWKERAAAAALREEGMACSGGPELSGTGLMSNLKFSYDNVIHFLWREPYITDVTGCSTLEPAVAEAIASLPHLK